VVVSDRIAAIGTEPNGGDVKAHQGNDNGEECGDDVHQDLLEPDL
jgi:hypothetical protein